MLTRNFFFGSVMCFTGASVLVNKWQQRLIVSLCIYSLAYTFLLNTQEHLVLPVDLLIAIISVVDRFKT